MKTLNTINNDFVKQIDVKQLQKDLRELGFSLVKLTGIYDLYTSWAVRELQIYAKMPFVAQLNNHDAEHYFEKLISIKNNNPYEGAISGVANLATLDTIYYWKIQQLRCPVVITACYPNTTTIMPNGENIWLHDDITVPAIMYAHDFTHYYPLAKTNLTPIDNAVILGKYVDYLKWGGPCSTKRHAWQDAEMTPENLTGVAFANMDAAQQSTYKVVRAVAEVECLGYFDCINAYDNAFVSLGPCHWILGIKPANAINNYVEEGELGAYFAYLQQVNPAAFKKAIGNFGVNVERNWATLFNSNQRKYTNWFSLENDYGSFTSLDHDEGEVNYFRTWHWFYRFAMAARTIESFRRHMWDMTCIRINDILTTPYPKISDMPFTNNLTIGDVFTSEQAVAMLLRWHIRFPADVINNGQAGRRLIEALIYANIPAKAGSPKQWNDQHEQQLIQSLDRQITLRANHDLRQTVNQVMQWSNSNLKLNAKRNSLKFISADGN